MTRQVARLVSAFPALLPSFQTWSRGGCCLVSHPIYCVGHDGPSVARWIMLLQYSTTLLPSVTIIARGMFCGARYTHHTFTPVIKHQITTTANKHPGKKSFTDRNIKNPTGIKLCISHKIATSREPPLKSYCPNKSNYKNYPQQID